jgi:hypothetical protein
VDISSLKISLKTNDGRGSSPTALFLPIVVRRGSQHPGAFSVHTPPILPKHYDPFTT